MPCILEVCDVTGTLIPVQVPPGPGTISSQCGGGQRVVKTVPWKKIAPYAGSISSDTTMHEDSPCSIVKYAPGVAAELALEDLPNGLVLPIPISVLVDHLSVVELKSVAKIHLVSFVPRTRDELVAALKEHRCVACEQYLTVVVPVPVAPLPVPRREYLEDMLSSIKSFSREEVVAWVDLPVELRPHYEFGAKVLSLRPVAASTPSSLVDAPHLLTSDTVPWIPMAKKAPRKVLHLIAQVHGISLSTRITNAEALALLEAHVCTTCPRYRVTLGPYKLAQPSKPPVDIILEPPAQEDLPSYPPEPLSQSEEDNIIGDFCEDLAPAAFEEAGCAVCGLLCLRSLLSPLSGVQNILSPLIEPGLVRLERRSSHDPVRHGSGPVLAPGLDRVCEDCVASLKRGKRPLNALANGFWVGEVPDELANLTFVEQLLVARIWTNRCVVRVSSGQSKMTANAISFSSPIMKVYTHLPPPREDLEEGLAFLFTGVSPPTDEDMKRTPMLVRRNVVKRALEWLRLNHADYSDLQIDRAALESYPEEGIPVRIKKAVAENGTNVIAASTSIHDTEEEQGTSSGPCPFTVCGLVGSSLESMTMAARKAVALHHLRVGGSVLAIGHSETPESMFDNPQLYPQIFPWIFPYGAGGMGNPRLRGLVSETNQKRRQLMYYDKRFQMDSRFVIIAFNQEQVKLGVTGSMILSRRSNFSKIVDQVLRINPSVITSIANRLQAGERVVPQTDQEKACFTIMDQIEHVAGRVHGSTAAKKMRRNELWSLIANKGAPSWFVTLSPADSKHPLCVYWADKNEFFTPEIVDYDKRVRLIACNPVAGARFFHYMVQLFIKHLLRWSDSRGRRGVFGHTAAYYGTVEQQGRMTLHLHILIWVICALSPQEIRDKLMSKDSEFTAELLAYLDDCQTGEFLTGPMEEMVSKFGPLKNYGGKGWRRGRLPSEVESSTVDDPTERLPVRPPPPSLCVNVECTCPSCEAQVAWESTYKETVDNVIYRSNIHKCFVRRDVVEDGIHKKHISGKGCINKDGVCTARFPRKIVEESSVDDEGHISLKKLEAQINTINRTMAYCYACNTDCTCLCSGTAVKATVGYVADYIVKMGLKTYQIFSSIYDVFERNPDIVENSNGTDDAARRLILKMANALTSKVEIGGPMASMYLLGNPDHYTSHTYVPLYWKQYVTYVLNAWASSSDLFCPDSADPIVRAVSSTFNNGCVDHHLSQQSLLDDDGPSDTEEDKVRITRSYGKIMSRSHVDDYRLRPEALESVCLYEWIQCSIRRPLATRGHVPVGHLSYLAGHPLADTHSVQYDISRVSSVVPNLLGPILPRSDADDTDFYATTMLTLFVPWRTGLELKTSDETWADAFDRIELKPRHAAIVSNLKIRYECYDARDDYHSQLLSQVAAQGAELAEGESDDEGDYDVDTAAAEYTDESELGAWSQRRQDQMKEVEAVLQASGWTVDGASDRVPFSRDFQPDKVLTARKWKELVASEKRKVVISRAGAVIRNTTHLQDDMDVWHPVANDARIIPGAYLLDNFKISDATDNELLKSTLTAFTLNPEQHRAFNIVAHHSLSLGAEPLRMYIGGMAGTGKSRVIDSLRHWFDIRGEPHRMVVLAPTGAAASVVSGSTYHSYLGVITGDRRKASKGGSDNALEEARICMLNVDYIFLDEISMVSCQDMFLIDARLKEISRVDDVPFGGFNVIVAGDFAQLPPAKGCALYSGEVSKVQIPRQVQSDQENTLGMLLWHHFVTVVILRENMRQTAPTERDKSLRVCLENMRYKSCTAEDLVFLRSLIPEHNPAIDMSDPRWRDVSVITAWNTHKDQINAMNAARFSAENKQVLQYFYSLDKQGRQSGTATRDRGKNKKLMAARSSQAPRVRLTRNVQLALWNSYPHSSEHVAGCLPMCLGMPVMIRNNDATELSITKGQEGVVRGWSGHEIPNFPGKQALDVLFVELTGSTVEKSTVKIPHLPDNVVPLTMNSTSIQAVLPNDSSISLTRHQVPVLLNFSMTDYASQGKTREVNVVDIRRSRNHQAVYTALSRGKNADATVILRDFSEKKVTGGLSGYLCQEFRDLELLDEITAERYKNKIPGDVIKQLRASTIMAYRQWKRSVALLLPVDATGESNEHGATRTNNQNISSRSLCGTKRQFDGGGTNVASKRSKHAHSVDVRDDQTLRETRRVAPSLKRPRESSMDTRQPASKKNRGEGSLVERVVHDNGDAPGVRKRGFREF